MRFLNRCSQLTDTTKRQKGVVSLSPLQHAVLLRLTFLTFRSRGNVYGELISRMPITDSIRNVHFSCKSQNI